MSHNDIPELDKQGLRQFGLILAAVLACVFGLFLPWSWRLDLLPNWYWIILAALVACWALLAPSSMKGFYHNWMRVAMAIGHVVNGFILAIVFYLLITPMGVIMRIAGKDPMRRILDPSINSYRIVCKRKKKQHMERPF